MKIPRVKAVLHFTLWFLQILSFLSPRSTKRIGRNLPNPSSRWLISHCSERLVWSMCVSRTSTFKVVTVVARDGQFLHPFVCMSLLASRWKSPSCLQCGDQWQASEVLFWDFWGYIVRTFWLLPRSFHYSWDDPSGSTASMLQRGSSLMWRLTHCSSQWAQPSSRPTAYINFQACEPTISNIQPIKPSDILSPVDIWVHHMGIPRDSYPDEYSPLIELWDGTKW